MSRIFDCFLFNNEKEILDLRIGYLRSIVDVFVIGESKVNFGGAPKNLEAKDLLINKYKDVEFVFMQYEPPLSIIQEAQAGNCWPIEKFARRSFINFIQNCGSSDTIILSDADEIPSKVQIELAIKEELVKLRTPLYYRRANWKVMHSSHWATVLAGKPKSYKDLDYQRHLKIKTIVKNEGIHLSWLAKEFEYDAFYNKTLTTSHKEHSWNLNILAERTRVADKFQVDHLGRFNRNYFGLLKVQNVTELNEIQRYFLKFYPEYFDFSKEQQPYLRRIYASYVLTQANSKSEESLNLGVRNIKVLRTLSKAVPYRFYLRKRKKIRIYFKKLVSLKNLIIK